MATQPLPTNPTTQPLTRFAKTIVSLRLHLILALILTCISAGSLIGQTSLDQGNAPVTQQHTPLEVANGSAKLVSRYDADAMLRLTVGIRAPKMAEEEALLATLQDPNSPSFHKYLTAEQWDERFAPAAEDEQAVVDWLTSNGIAITHRFANRLIVDAEAPSAVIENAFAVHINRYLVGENAEFSNDRDPAIPAHLANIVLTVGGLNSIQHVHSANEGDFHRMRPDYSPGPVFQEGGSYRHDGNPEVLDAAMQATEDKVSAREVSSALAANHLDAGAEPELTSTGLLEPSDIYSSYGYDFRPLQNLGHCCNPTSDPNGSTPTTSIGIATVGKYANSDLEGFLAAYPYLASNVSEENIDGTPVCCNLETTLDVEWATATSNSFSGALQNSNIWAY